jgi:hypothetical protein
MIVCPNCKHKNMSGTMFCDECGGQLVGRDAMITQTIITGQLDPKEVGYTPPQSYQSSAVADAWGTLHLLDTGQLLPLADRNEFTIGRISEGQPIMPDIDLSPYQAYASGVSRLHAVVKYDSQRVVIMDLGSANGTYVNGKRLVSNVEQIINHGDIIALGKLKIQILMKK